ncbi:MAG: FR47-like protein [Actinomycetota bacterium]|jgi:GNAT superfamily N-acetyltransferase
MPEINSYEDVDLKASMYVRVTSAPENFLAGWREGDAQAVALSRASGNFIYFSKPSTPAFYARTVMAATSKLGEIKEITVHPALAEKLNPKAVFPWIWMSKFDQVLPDFSHLNLEIVSDAKLNNQIHAFIVRSGFEAHFLPGHPEIEFWAVAWNGDRTAIEAVAAGSRRISGERVLNTVLVAPSLRGRGLGKAITAAATAEIQRLGSSVVHLGVKGTNVQAMRVYESLGFEITDELASLEL